MPQKVFGLLNGKLVSGLPDLKFDKWRSFLFHHCVIYKVIQQIWVLLDWTLLGWWNQLTWWLLLFLQPLLVVFYDILGQHLWEFHGHVEIFMK